MFRLPAVFYSCLAEMQGLSIPCRFVYRACWNQAHRFTTANIGSAIWSCAVFALHTFLSFIYVESPFNSKTLSCIQKCIPNLTLPAMKMACFTLLELSKPLQRAREQKMLNSPLREVNWVSMILNRYTFTAPATAGASTWNHVHNANRHSRLHYNMSQIKIICKPLQG